MAQIIFTNAGGITAQSTITATDFVGNLPTSYLTSTTSTPAATSIYMKDKGIYIWSDNADVDIWHIDGDGTGWNNSYGFNLLYKGTQSGDDNDLILYAHNQASTHVEVYRVHQSGQFVFKSTPKVGTTDVSLANHTHNYAGSASAGGPATDFVASKATDNSDRFVYFAYNSNDYNPASAASAAKGKAVVSDNFKFNPNNGRITSTEIKADKHYISANAYMQYTAATESIDFNFA